MSSGAAALRRLAEEFWIWREAAQPDSYDDITRVERPDGWLPDWSPASVAERRRVLAEFTRRHRDTDLSAAPVAVQVDAALMGSAVARVHWELDLLRDWQRNPCFYIDQSLVPVYNLLLQPPPFCDTRARAVVDRLACVPDVLEQGKLNLPGHAAAPFGRYALRLLGTADEALGTAMAALAPLLPATQATRLAAGTAAAQRALVDYREWIQVRLPSFTGPVSPGPEAFRHFLHEVALLPYSVDRLRDMGRQEYARAATSELTLRHRHRELPEPSLLAGAAEQIDRQRADEHDIRSFLAKEGIVDLPDELRHYRNAPMPPYLEPLTWLGVPHYTASAARRGEDALRYIREPRPDLPYFQLAEARDPRVGIVHEGIHAWQAALSWGGHNPLRRRYYDSAANEGVAFYSEELLLLTGLFDDAPASGLFLVNAMRLRALRVEIDIGLALGELTLEQAAARLAECVPMDCRTAWEEAAFFAGHPGQGLSYLVGKMQVLDLMTACAHRLGASFSLSAFHGRLWREGNVPLALQRWEILGSRDHVDEALRLGGE